MENQGAGGGLLPTYVYIGRTRYPKEYKNEELFFPPSPYYMELPISNGSLYLLSLQSSVPRALSPGGVRVIYDNLNGEIMGVVAHPEPEDRGFVLAKDYRARWFYHHQLRQWVYRAPDGTGLQMENLCALTLYHFKDLKC